MGWDEKIIYYPGGELIHFKKFYWRDFVRSFLRFSEREADRIKIIPFQSWTGDLLPEERERKSKVVNGIFIKAHSSPFFIKVIHK